MRRWWALLAITLFMVTGCETAEPEPTLAGPRLVAEETLPPPTTTPLQLFSPSEAVIASPTADISPTGVETRSLAVLRTPTPPDTLTPTITDTPTVTPSVTITRTTLPTRTQTPSITPTFTASPFRSATPLASATSSNVAITTPSCPFSWFFTPAPPNCPLTGAVSSTAAIQTMEGGRMIWVQTGATIFVLYNDQNRFPAWEFVPDTYVQGEDVTILGQEPPFGRFQPQRGFGKVWRDGLGVRERLGWGTQVEVGYTAFIQADSVSGDRYITGAEGDIYRLLADQRSWVRVR